MTFADTIAAIREQGGLVYLPHPFDRMHAIPTRRRCTATCAEIDVFEVYNARLLFEALQRRGAALRAQVRPDRWAPAPTRTCSRASARARCACARFDGPEEFLISPAHAPRSCAGRSRSRYLQTLKWVAQVKEKVARRSREGPRNRPWPPAVPTDEIYERYLEEGDHRDQRARPRDRAAAARARARARLRPPARRHLPAQVRARRPRRSRRASPSSAAPGRRC